MSSPAARRDSPVEAVAGLMASLSIAVSLIGLAYRPVRVVPFAVVVALVAVAFGGRHQRLATVAVLVGGLCFAGGLTIAVITKNPIY